MTGSFVQMLDEALAAYVKQASAVRERQLQKLVDLTGANGRDLRAMEHRGVPLRVQYIAPNSAVSLWEEWSDDGVTFRFEYEEKEY